MQIESKKLSEVVPYYNNPRDNTKAVAPVMESFKKFGFIKPIIVDRNMMIIAGHTRYIAAFQLGLEYVPVIVSDMDDEKAKRFRIADNKLAEKSEFDEQELIEELKRMEVPQEMQAFFFEDIDTMLNFNYNQLSAQAEEYGGLVDVVDSTQSETNTLQEDFEDNESDKEVESEDEMEFEDCRDLYKVFKRDNGTLYMKVICPYCGNKETIDIER